jgi:hypothetical protein
VHGIAKPHPLTRRLIRTAFRLGLTIGEKVAPDPEESLPEIHRRRKADTGHARPATKREIAQAAGCPVHPRAARTEPEPAAITEAAAARANA